MHDSNIQLDLMSEIYLMALAILEMGRVRSKPVCLIISDLCCIIVNMPFLK